MAALVRGPLPLLLCRCVIVCDRGCVRVCVVPAGTIYAADPSNGTLTQFLTLRKSFAHCWALLSGCREYDVVAALPCAAVGTGSSLGVIGAHGNWLYAMSST